MRMPIYFLVMLLAGAAGLAASDSFSEEEKKMLQDSGGWEYLTLSDPHNIQTVHTCFDGQPHPQECSGTLTLTSANTFVQSVKIQGHAIERHGTYQLDGDRITFLDEFGIEDGPFVLHLDVPAKHLQLETPQLRMELELESQYREDRKARKPAKR